jgi:hypothetical protein
MLDARSVYEQADLTGSATPTMKTDFEKAEKAFNDWKKDTYEKAEKEWHDLRKQGDEIRKAETRVNTIAGFDTALSNAQAVSDNYKSEVTNQETLVKQKKALLDKETKGTAAYVTAENVLN